MSRLKIKSSINQLNKLSVAKERWQCNYNIRTIVKAINNDACFRVLMPNGIQLPNDLRIFTALKLRPVARCKKYNLLILQLKQLIKYYPSNWYYKMLLATSYHLNGNGFKCIAICKHVFANDIKSAPLYYNMGVNAFRYKDYAFAIDCLSRSIEYDVSMYNSYLMRAFLYKKIDEKELGLADAAYLITHGMHLKEAVYLQMHFKFYLYRSKENALGYIDSLVAMGTNAENLHEIAHVYREIKDFENSLIYINQVVALSPYDTEAICCRANIKIKLGMYHQAISDIEKALKIDNLFPVAFRNRARAYVGLNKIYLAIQDYRKFLELSPNDEDGIKELEDLKRNNS